MELTTELFDAWTTEQSEEAIKTIAASKKVKTIITPDGIFAGRFPDGHILSTPLNLTQATMEKLLNATEASGMSELEQLKVLVDLVGNAADAEYVAGADLLSLLDYARKYFEAFERISQVSMGESLG